MNWDHIVVAFYFSLMFLYYSFLILLYFKILGDVEYKYLYNLNNFIQLFIAVFLLFRYHPFKTKYELSRSDINLIFASACFLIVNLGILHYFSDWVWKQYSHIKDISSNSIA